jgi:hypothetical protein
MWIGIWHSCLNSAHDIDVQTTQVDEWHSCIFHMNLWKIVFAQLLLPNYGPLSLGRGNKYVIMYSHVTKNYERNIWSKCKDLCVTKVVGS